MTLMSHSRELGRRAVFVAAFAVGSALLCSAANADTVTDDNVVAMTESAKTPAEFQALATYYKDKAVLAKAAAKRHQSMLTAIGLGTSKPPYTFTPHCRRLIRLSKEQAADYTAMASAYEKMATAKSSAP